MPSDDDQQSIFRSIEDELCAMRQAIIKGDIDALERHTAASSELLAQLMPALTNTNARPPRLSLHDVARNVLVLVEKGRRNVCAVGAVFRFVVDCAHAETELQ